jgi:hypothetical protein
MSAKNFRIGLVFTPTSLVSVGVLNSNQKEAYTFMEKIQPLIDDFMNSVREAAVCKRGKLDKIVSKGERRKRKSSEDNHDA